LTLSQPDGLKVTASEPAFLHVALILQVISGRDFKPGFRARADSMLTSLLRQTEPVYGVQRSNELMLTSLLFDSLNNLCYAKQWTLA